MLEPRRARKLLQHFGERKPIGERLAAPQCGAQLRAGNSFAVLRYYLLGGQIQLLARRVRKLRRGDNGHGQLGLMFLYQLLRGERRIKRSAGPVRSGPRVVAADDKMRRAVIAPHECVPQRLARARHPHRKFQERECRI